MSRLIALGEVLGGKNIPYDHHLILPSGGKWQLDTLCAIVESDD